LKHAGLRHVAEPGLLKDSGDLRIAVQKLVDRRSRSRFSPSCGALSEGRIFRMDALRILFKSSVLLRASARFHFGELALNLGLQSS
jgi:hypothetical protein